MGIEEIDKDHQHLIGLINEFITARTDGRSVEILSGLLEKLKTYSLEHFYREEAYMLKKGQLNYTDHVKEHERFINKVYDFENTYQDDKVLLAIKMMPFMMEWLVNHIMTTDKQLAEAEMSA